MKSARASMESFFSRFKNALVLIAILLVQTIALATQIRRPESPSRPDGGNVLLIRLWALALVTPFERASTATGHGVGGLWRNYLDLRHVRQQNLDLQHQIGLLRMERAALAEDALQGQRLQKLLDFRRNYVSTTVVAQVIGASATDQGRTLILDKGWQDGLKPDMAVITPDGVVGKVRDVGRHTSQLLLLSDATSGAGVLLETTRIRAIVRGTSTGRLMISNLTADPRIHAGEPVLTSGGDQIYPRGLPVGTIASIAPDPEHQPYSAIMLRPAADLNRLDEVLVITGLGNALDPKAEAELNAEAQAHAADVTAERLPSLHDGKPDATADPNAVPGVLPPANNSSGVVPKPRPAAHPDTYTPNATPPADQLTPGAPH